ncbi:alpha/beta hydrolase family protein [Sphingosinicella terrae]|uniref:alpha/beta hydrolase family protein n=1 Tax=Sphingosinicella terrae TaxID=2172047 RepID=UPI000E0D6865|nr:alpha/beta fold hydrolase [Sphingosinicella terrae]
MYKSMLFVAGLFVSGSAFAQAAANPAELFGVRESVEHIDISPDGRRVLFLQPGPGRSTMVFVHELDGDGQPRLVANSDGDPERMIWCNFAGNERIVCRVIAVTDYDGLLISMGRLVAFDADDGQNVQLLGQRNSYHDARLRQFDGAIIDWVPDRDGMVMMSRDYVPEAGMTHTRIARRADGLGVDMIDVRNLRASRIEAPNAQASWYLSDGRANVRMMGSHDVRGATGQLGTRTDIYYRTAADRSWRSFGSYDAATREGMIPLAVDATVDSAYVLQKLDGRFALYRVKLDGSMATELVFAHDRVDVDDVVRSSDGGRVIGLTFAEDRRRVVYFDEEYERLSRTLARAMPNLPLIDFGTASDDGNRILVHAGSDADPGRYFVHDRQARTLNEIMLVRPQLENVPLATVQAVSYPSADGVSIPAYLTLPPGQEARGLPAVVLPHGGPSARDEWGFDWLAQYLAHLGYAVLQPNYRGSAGFGDQWLQQNGFRSWRTSIGDIVAGARWLASEGTADANRLAVVGWSYGGYAALQSGVVEPGLFKAIVAIAPVTDLQLLKDEARDFTNSRNVAEFIGSGPHVAEGSPLRRAAALQAPVLLVHGDRDINVSIDHSRRMDAALEAAGKESELIVFPGLAHDLGDSSARTQMLQRIGNLLGERLAAR